MTTTINECDFSVAGSVRSGNSVMVIAADPIASHDIIYLVDDDDSMRASLVYVLSKAGFNVRSFASGHEFLEEYSEQDCGCVVLDLEMPGMSGMQLARTLSDRKVDSPFIVLTGYGSISTAVEAMRLGASDFIEKPVEHRKLIECIQKASSQARSELKRELNQRQIQLPTGILTSREQEILTMVIDGVLTKQIASALSISPKTVDVHRSHIMKKLGVTSVAQLMKKVMLP